MKHNYRNLNKLLSENVILISIKTKKISINIRIQTVICLVIEATAFIAILKAII